MLPVCMSAPTPSALEYLTNHDHIAENASADAYVSQSYGSQVHEPNDELTYTERCVVWSRDGAIRKVLTYDDTQHAVRSACITDFTCVVRHDKQSLPLHTTTSSHADPSHGESDLTFADRDTSPSKSHISPNSHQSAPSTRAVCVVTSREIYIHFLHGESFVVSTTFDIHYATPMADGLILKRAASADRSVVRHGLGYDLLEDPPSLYSIRDPVKGLCAIRQCRPGDDLPPNPSQSQEMPLRAVGNLAGNPVNDARGQNTVLVTLNQVSGQLTIWQYWHVDPPRLASVMQKRATFKALQDTSARGHRSSVHDRRSMTPTVRRDGNARRSYASSMRPRSDTAASGRQNRMSKGAQDIDDDEIDQLARRINPVLAKTTKSHHGRRRVSSLLSRADLAAGDPSATAQIANTGSQRAHMPSAVHDRMSIGASMFRKSRASTHGSMLAPSIEVDLSESTSSMDCDRPDSGYKGDVRYDPSQHIGSVPFSINSELDGPSHDLAMRRLYSLGFDESYIPTESMSAHVKVLSLTHNDGFARNHSSSLYVLHTGKKKLIVLDVNRPSATHDPVVADTDLADDADIRVSAMSISTRCTITNCIDIINFRQGNATAVLCLLDDSTVHVMTTAGTSWCVPVPQTIVADSPQALRHSTSYGHVDVMFSKGIYVSLEIRLEPRDMKILPLLGLIRHVLGSAGGPMFADMWAWTRTCLGQSEERETDETRAEWQALLVATYAFAAASTEDSTSTSEHASAAQSDASLSSPANDNSADVTGTWDWIVAQHPAAACANGSNQGQTKNFQQDCLRLSRKLLRENVQSEWRWLSETHAADRRSLCLLRILLAGHLFREERKLSVLSDTACDTYLLPMLAQLGTWLGMPAWSGQLGTYYAQETSDIQSALLGSVIASLSQCTGDMKATAPCSILAWLESMLYRNVTCHYPSLQEISGLGNFTTDCGYDDSRTAKLLPRTTALQQFVRLLPSTRGSAHLRSELFVLCGLTETVLDTLPEAIAAPCRDAALRAQLRPVPRWPESLLRVVGRQDLVHSRLGQSSIPRSDISSKQQPRELQAACTSAERAPLQSKTDEVGRHTLTHLLFAEDRRFMDAKLTTDSMADQVAECPPQPDWSEVQHLEHQKRILQYVVTRTTALPSGDAMIHFECQETILSEKVSYPNMEMKCKMKPMDIVRVADSTYFTEEKMGWAFFHAGVSRGLHISKSASGIDTSWIAFNKPAEPSNRHAGLLLALGLTGHLHSLAKWLAYKYLSQKHTMTSVGLLLGLAASHIGDMDMLTTQMLSIHIMRMLPPGSASLNVSPLTQTAGLIGLGLVYCNTQHRRMTEITLSELEHRAVQEQESNLDSVQEESYRLAAGFALGYINLGHGHDIKGLYGLGLLERLLAIAIGARPIDLVHVVDKAIPAAVIAIALIFMKSGDSTVAQKIDIPESTAQLDHVRPDVLLLRILAKHMIMWNEIRADTGWVHGQLPPAFAARLRSKQNVNAIAGKTGTRLSSADLPLYNVLTGIAWSLSLRYAGSGNKVARDEILGCLDMLHDIVKEEASYYDAILARDTIRRCIDLLALAAATVMAGTGDLRTFRYLRRLHGRLDAVTAFGSHLACHLAIGALFLGGGTYSFGTSNMAIASLICAFYPLFPAEASDNGAHLQALRHMWVFAAEPRCIVIKDIDSQRAVCIDLEVRLCDGTVKLCKSPCLLPEFNSIATIATRDDAYWGIVLELERDLDALARFRKSQTVFVRRRSVQSIGALLAEETLASINAAQDAAPWRRIWRWLFTLDALGFASQANLDSILGGSAQSVASIRASEAVLDTQLALVRDAKSDRRDDLLNARLLFAWADAMAKVGEEPQWLGRRAIEALKTTVERRLAS